MNHAHKFIDFQAILDLIFMITDSHFNKNIPNNWKMQINNNINKF